jgi:hypothetical protein
MKDYLLDIVQHTFDLGCIDLIKITGTDSATTVGGLAEDKSVIIDAQFANPMADFVGTFGMPNLGKLKTLLNLQEYREDAKLAVTRKANGELDGITFENKVGDFKNNYRFMASDIVNDKLKTLKFKGVNWHITFEPTVAAIQRLRMQAQANSEELNFQVKTDGKDLKFFFGDHSTHSGNFVFQHDIAGALKHAWSWPVSQVMSILSLTGDKTMQISDDGCMQITVNSGLAVYNYILPAQTK